MKNYYSQTYDGVTVNKHAIQELPKSIAHIGNPVLEVEPEIEIKDKYNCCKYCVNSSPIQHDSIFVICNKKYWKCDITGEIDKIEPKDFICIHFKKRRH